MIVRLKALIARHWPVLRLRTIIFGTLLFVAALPGFGAVFLRVYENALVRRTEGELIAQSAALAASVAVLWPPHSSGIAAGRPIAPDRGGHRSGHSAYNEPSTGVDLRSSPILPPRPSAAPPRVVPVAEAMSVADHMLPAFAETRQTTLSSILMLDRNGTILNGTERGRSLSTLPEVRSALEGKAETVFRRNENYISRYPFEWVSRASNIRLHHARPIKVSGRTEGVLLVSRSPRPLFRGIYEDRGKIALGIALIFGALVGLSGILSRTIVRPIENLSRATRMLASGRQVEPVYPSLQVVEIRALFRDFEAMAASIDKRSRYLRDIASAVSHEFKTPLAGISGAIELLQDHGVGMAPADRERFLRNMAGDAERLSRLVKRLMELAKADLHEEDTGASTDPSPILTAIVDGLGSEDFCIEVSLPETVPMLAIDAAPLESVVTILADNARQADARTLSIKLRREGELAVIDIVDDGPGIAPGDRERIFDPFFTTKRITGGTGLGLSIARSLMQAYGGTVEFIPSHRGAHFRLLCPIIRASA